MAAVTGHVLSFGSCQTVHSFFAYQSVWGGVSDIWRHLFDSFVIIFTESRVLVIFCMLLVIANKAYGTCNRFFYYVIDESIFYI